MLGLRGPVRRIKAIFLLSHLGEQYEVILFQLLAFVWCGLGLLCTQRIGVHLQGSEEERRRC